MNECSSFDLASMDREDYGEQITRKPTEIEVEVAKAFVLAHLQGKTLAVKRLK